jgi:hypothetical protein
MCHMQTLWNYRSCEYGYVIRVLILLYLSLTGFDVCLATVQIVIASQKSKKSKRVAAYEQYEFCYVEYLS